MIAGVAIDKWKLKIFEKHLKDAGFSWTRHPGLTADTLLLKVPCESAAALQPTIEAAQLACARSRMN